MTPYEKITVIIAGFAAISAGLYYIWNVRKTRTVIKVEPYVSIFHPDDNETIGIKVINNSDHAVTLEEIGVKFSHTTVRMTTPIPITRDGRTIPCRIEPHSSFEGTFEQGLYVSEPNMVYATHVYARLANGKYYENKIHFNPAKERAGVQL